MTYLLFSGSGCKAVFLAFHQKMKMKKKQLREKLPLGLQKALTSKAFWVNGTEYKVSPTK